MDPLEAAPSYSPEEYRANLHNGRFDFNSGLAMGEKYFGYKPEKVKACFIKIVTAKELPVVSIEEEDAFSGIQNLFCHEDFVGIPINEKFQKMELIRRYLQEMGKFLEQVSAELGISDLEAPSKESPFGRPHLKMSWKTYWMFRMLICTLRSHREIAKNDKVDEMLPLFSAAVGSVSFQAAIQSSIASGMEAFCNSERFNELMSLALVKAVTAESKK